MKEGSDGAVRAAQASWVALGLTGRAAHLREVARRFTDSADALAELVVAETGKAAADAWFADIVPNLDLFTWWTGPGARSLQAQRVPLSSLRYPAKEATLSWDPRGIVGVITPWNYPVALPLRVLIPALLAGNAVLFKPSEITPRTGAAVAELFTSVLPGGVLTLVQGGADAGRAVVDRADHVVFIGGRDTGREVARRCAERLITTSLELGGKDAAIVLRDCDLDRTVAGVLWGAFTNSGQNCAGIERVYVDQEIAGEFTRRLIAAAAQTEVAPAATEAQAARVAAHLADAQARGATLHGSYPPGPVVATDVPADALLMTEETFGPVCPVTVVSGAAEALRLANASEYGLTLSLWTRDEARARQLAEQARAGVVTVNNVSFTASMPFAPWAGRGSSGSGVTNSVLSAHELARPKFTLVDFGRDPEPWWYPTAGAVDLARKTLAWVSASTWARAARTPGLLAALRRRARQQRELVKVDRGR